MGQNRKYVFPIREQIRITDMYSLFTIHYADGFAFSGESHNFWECVFVREGYVCVSADDRVYNLQSGEIIFHKPMEFHKFIVNSPQGVDLLIFSFSAEGDLTTFLRDKVFRLSEFQIQLVNAMLSYIHTRNTILPSTQLDAYHFLQPFEHNSTYSQMFSSYLVQLFLSLAENGSISSVSSAPDAITFSKAVIFLNYNLHQSLSIQEIAKAVNTSESTLKRLFDKYAGISVHKYLMALKIKAATELLRDGESAAVVAEKLGFNSQSYFSKAYKKATGMRPSDIK